MPLYPTRNEPTKKIQILAKRELELEKSIYKKVGTEKVNSNAQKVRLAYLNLLKAQLALIKP